MKKSLLAITVLIGITTVYVAMTGVEDFALGLHPPALAAWVKPPFGFWHHVVVAFIPEPMVIMDGRFIVGDIR